MLYFIDLICNAPFFNRVQDNIKCKVEPMQYCIKNSVLNNFNAMELNHS